jgi:hypothetical protein
MGTHLAAFAARLAIRKVRREWDVKYRLAVQELRDALKPQERRIKGAAVSAVVRGAVSDMKLEIAEAVLLDLDITPTIRTGQITMWRIFGEARGGSSHLKLRARFAEVHRNAETKFVHHARERLALPEAEELAYQAREIFDAFLQYYEGRKAEIRAALRAG